MLAAGLARDSVAHAVERPWQSLVVDDDPVRAEATATMLRRLGLATDLLGDGQALQASALQRYDLVLLDRRSLPARQRTTAELAPYVVMLVTGREPHEDGTDPATGVNEYLRAPATQQCICGLVRRFWLARSGHTGLGRPRPSDKAAIIDARRFLRLIDLDQAASADTALAQLFSRDCSELLQQIRGALSQSNFLAARGLVHQLKGSAATLGALRVRSLCEELDATLASADENSDQTQQVERLEDGVDEAQVILSALER